MGDDSSKSGIEKRVFLLRYRFTEKQFEETGLDWSLMEQIYDRYASMEGELQTTADYISKRLQTVPAVHSLKIRIKHPEHLVEKLIRKKMKDALLTVDLASYETCATDLVGVRALHLFKDEWRVIHEFVEATWELQENPIAYVRAGDDQSDFRDANLDVREHKFGYRSIHYLLKLQPTKNTRIAELQVRTLFEEGWSEIDHRIRYPRHSDDPYLAQFLTIFNRLAGSADEMGTFIKVLSSYVAEQSAKIAYSEQQIADKEKVIQKAVSQLKISETQKQSLQTQITELRQSSIQASNIVVTGVHPISVNLGLTSSDSILKNYGLLSGIGGPTCAKCGKIYFEPGMRLDSVCSECRKASPS